MIDEKQRETNSLRHCITQVNTKCILLLILFIMVLLVVCRWCKRGSNNKAQEKGRTWFRNIVWSLLVEFMKMLKNNGRKRGLISILRYFLVIWFKLFYWNTEATLKKMQ